MAACDPAGTVAFPVGAVPAGHGEQARLLALVVEREPIEVVVGLPVSLSGTEGPAAATVRAKAAALASALRAHRVGVRLLDERLTTVSAARQLRESGRSARQQRSVIDAQAAVVILEQALAVERSGKSPFGELVSLEPAPDQEC